MPWSESTVVDQRLRFVSALQSEEASMTELCERFGISRKTGYKWRDRYRGEGPPGLLDRSHAPLHHGRTTDAALADAIVQLKQARPSWGPGKIVARLKLDHPDLAWPARSTAETILKREGLVQPRHRRQRVTPSLDGLTQPERPNHVWAVDHKGWVRLGDGRRCEPLTITDGFSRFLVAVSAGDSTCEEQARPWFEAAFAEFGLPDAIRSDNGPPFAATGVTALTNLSVWWIKLGIRHERITPGKPQQNGRHERFHRTLLEAMHPLSVDQKAQSERFASFRHDYNHHRPHQALGQLPPAALYRPSPRKLPDRLAEPDYPTQAVTRKVRSNGCIKWRGELVHISKTLCTEPVCLEETEEGHWRVRFFERPLGVIRRNERRLRRLTKDLQPDPDV
jgi:putative transposase